MAGPGRLEELELSSEEAERLQRAFRDERFRALFAEYAAELADPEQRRLYEEEVTALERERGVEVRFIHPTPGYVLRTSQAGSRRCYLNICSNPHVAPPQARAEPGGQRWALPHSLAPGREELGRAGRRCLVYDVVFHPAALRLAARSARFRRLLSDVAMEAVESRFSAQLDRANASVLRGARYKGVPQAPVIRSPLPGGAPQTPSDTALPPPPPLPPPSLPSAAPPPAPGPTTPRWSVRHRSYVDLQDYCHDSAPGPVPRELVVTVELPLLRSAAQAELEVRPRELRLDSRRPAYRLRLRLPYRVDESAGRAVFDKAERRLLVTLPVVPPPGPGAPLGEAGGERWEQPREEARPGPELPDQPATASSLPPRSEAAFPSAGPEPGASFPAPSAGSEPAPPDGAPPPCPAEGGPGHMAHPRGGGDSGPATAACPPFRCRQDEASLTLLLPVPGIQPQSLSGEVAANRYSVRFSSGAVAYALILQFPAANRLAAPETSVSVGAHNAVILLAKAAESTGLWEKYCFGLDASALQERLFVSEENIDGFLRTVLCPSSCMQSELEAQTSIEVLDVSEDRTQIRLKAQEAASSERDETKQAVSSSGGVVAAKNNGDHLQTEPEPEHAATGTAEQRPAQNQRAAGSLVTAETIGEVDGSAQHCLQQEPSDTGAALPGKPGGKERALDEAFAGLGLEGGRARGVESPAASPLLQEVGEDGSVQSITDHSTHCSIAFQNSVLYELD
ncbi:protein kintoun [Centrocercus urophasianus]|uniref:protein kintoun n=1 Tax=Centrocercus urophasianus TaxID=9002 RepID=UPI001C6476F8|nr:protein kintoun [Centrocercus urophasianus]